MSRNSQCKRPDQLALPHTGTTHGGETFCCRIWGQKQYLKALWYFQLTLNQVLQSGAGSGMCCERRSAPSFKPNFKWLTTGDGTLNICRSSSFIQIYAIIHFLLTIVFAFVFLSTADAPAELNCSLPHPRTWESLSLKYLLFDHFEEMFFAPS